jgi:hypothetical protein
VRGEAGHGHQPVRVRRRAVQPVEQGVGEQAVADRGARPARRLPRAEP